MRIARYDTPDGPVTGEYADGQFIPPDADPIPAAPEDLLAPCEPTALYCVGRNYTDTIELMGYDAPETPDFFIKPPVSVIGPGDPIPYPGFSTDVTYAGELAAVIGTRCERLSPDEVPEHVQGYTILNDVDALDQQSVTTRKAFTGSGPLGPWIETDIDPTSVPMRTTINGSIRQDATTDQMLFDPYELVSFVSHRLRLFPGDVVAFGSPANPGNIEPSDRVRITYEGIGTLENTVTEPAA